MACLLLAANAGPADTARPPAPATEPGTVPGTDSLVTVTR
jgi:hypothetical protein